MVVAATTAASIVVGPLDVSKAGGAERDGQFVGGLADEHRSADTGGHDSRELADGHALRATASDEHERLREGVQRSDDRIRLRALRVVDIANAVHRGDQLEAMFDARERGHGPATASGAMP